MPCTLLSLPSGPSPLQNLTPNCKILTVIWTLVLGKVWTLGEESTDHFKFFNWLSNLTNFVFSNGSINVQNVIQMPLKKLFFPKTLEKIALKSRLKFQANTAFGSCWGSASDHRLRYVLITQLCSPRLPI